MGLLKIGVLCCLVTACYGICPAFVEIPEEQYDRNYSSIDQADRRPLGFTRETFHYDDPSRQNPCYTVSGVANRMVEILFETIPSANLCIETDGDMVCSDGRHTSCKQTHAGTVTVNFTCDVAHGCSENDVNFWLRITKGPPPEEDTEGMWCLGRAAKFPEDLAPLPTHFTPATNAPTTPGGGPPLRGHNVLVLLALALLATTTAGL